LWVLAACVFGIGELLTTSFFLAPFALGGAVAAIVNVAGAGALPAWLAFIVVSLATLLVLRPIAVSHLHSGPQLRTGAAALVGKPAIVLETISNREGVGCVKIDGDVWTARAFDDDRVIERGTHVEVVDIKGATALVME
jgi:membrane protein implicated in regulation of membrane protease activity